MPPSIKSLVNQEYTLDLVENKLFKKLALSVFCGEKDTLVRDKCKKWGDKTQRPFTDLFLTLLVGTSDEHITVVENLKHYNPDGAILVTTPQVHR